MFPLIKREFLRNRTSFIIYCVISVGFVWMYIALFPSIKEQSAQLDDLLKAFPDSFMKAFGIERASYGKVENYLASELMTFLWPILAVILSVSRAGSSIAGDIENRTIGIELSLPISRSRIYFAKFIGGMVSILVFCFFSIFSILPFCALYNIDIKAGNISMLFLLCVLFCCSIFAMSLFFSAYVSEKGKVYFAVGGILIVSYVANIVALISDGFYWLRHFAFFHYFTSFDALNTGTITWGSIFFFLGLTFISTALGMWKFINRDISI